MRKATPQQSSGHGGPHATYDPSPLNGNKCGGRSSAPSARGSFATRQAHAPLPSARLAADVDRVQAHDVIVAQLAQQHDLPDRRRRHAIALLHARRASGDTSDPRQAGRAPSSRLLPAARRALPACAPRLQHPPPTLPVLLVRYASARPHAHHAAALSCQCCTGRSPRVKSKVGKRSTPGSCTAASRARRLPPAPWAGAPSRAWTSVSSSRQGALAGSSGVGRGRRCWIMRLDHQQAGRKGWLLQLCGTLAGRGGRALPGLNVLTASRQGRGSRDLARYTTP